MSIEVQTLGFASGKKSLEEALGVDLPNNQTLTIVEGNLNGDGRFSTVLVSADYSYDITAGLYADFERPSLGAFDVTYPINVELDLPDFFNPGESLDISLLPHFSIEAAVIDGESISLGDVTIQTRIASDGARLENPTFFNAFGGSLIDPDVEPLIINPFDTGLLDLISFNGASAASEIIDGVDLQIALPDGESVDGEATTVRNTTTLSPITLFLNESLIQISANPLEILDDIPALRGLDVLTEDYDWDLGDGAIASFDYTLIAPYISAGYDLVQSISFIPTAVDATIEIGEKILSGSFGDTFTFETPEDSLDSIMGTATYDLGGSVEVAYELRPTGRIGTDILGANVSLELDGVTNSIAFGPVASPELSASTSIGAITILEPTKIDLPEGFFAPVSMPFTIPKARGQDIAFVIDTTGSMYDDIDAVKARSSSIIDAIFDPERELLDSRVAVVGYNDPNTSTLLSFTDQPDVAARKAAALDAISSISVGGGGDLPEYTYSGLLRALDGRAGEWRDDAVARKIILFGDAPAKDAELSSTVYSLASDLNIDIGGGGAARAMSTFAVSDEISLTSFTVTEVDVETGSAHVVPVQIYTVAIGSDPGTIAEFEEIAYNTGGSALSAADASEIVDKLLEVINLPIYSITADASSLVEGDSGQQVVTFTVSRDVPDEAAIVEVAFSGSVDELDVTEVPAALNFSAGETSKSFDVSIKGDTTFESDETLTVAIRNINAPATIGVNAASLVIVNDDAETSPFFDRPTTASGPAPVDVGALKDYDGNDFGSDDAWKVIGSVDVEGDGDVEYIYVNEELGRWATVGPDEDGNVDFSDFGQGSDTRIVGNFAGETFGQFQGDLKEGDLDLIAAYDFDADGFQEIYFQDGDSDTYVHAIMHKDGNVKTVEYQSGAEVQTYLSGLGFGEDVVEAIVEDTAQTTLPPVDLSAIKDEAGNDLGAADDWTYIGQTDVEGDGDSDYLYVNPTLGRFAHIGLQDDDTVDFTDFAGDTRVAAVYVDPGVAAGLIEEGGPVDSATRFAADLKGGNLELIEAFDYDGDGRQEIYFDVKDEDVFLRAIMQDDGDLRYANYQNASQVESYLSGLGYEDDVAAGILSGMGSGLANDFLVA